MNQTPYTLKMLISILSLSPCFLILSCGGSNGGSGSGGEKVVDADYAYQAWPNESTSDTGSFEITSKVLVSDLDKGGEKENIFISVLPSSTDKKGSVLRVTTGINFSEVVNYKSTRVSLLQDSIPFAFDINRDGFKELIFVSFDKDQVYAFEFKNKLKKIFIRWRADLPEVLAEDFQRRLKIVEFNDEFVIKVGPFGLKEKKNKKVSVVDMRTGSPN